VSFLSANRTWQRQNGNSKVMRQKRQEVHWRPFFFLFSYKDGFAGTSREEEGSNLIQDGGRG